MMERQIDQLVYELYGLTDEEIALVEGVGEREKEDEPAESRAEVHAEE